MTDPVWAYLFRRLSLANLAPMVHEPQLLLMAATNAMNEAIRSSDSLTGWRSLRLSLDEDPQFPGVLVLSVSVTEHSGTRLSSPREVWMVFDVESLSAEMATVRDVMET
jgi:hypothetical protein